MDEQLAGAERWVAGGDAGDVQRAAWSASVFKAVTVGSMAPVGRKEEGA